jgi:hypothetical protein
MYTLREGGGRVLTIEGRGDLHEMPDAPDWPPRVRPKRPGEDGLLQVWEVRIVAGRTPLCVASGLL